MARLSALWTNTCLLCFVEISKAKKVQALSFLAQICTNDIQHREDYGLNFKGPSIGVRNSLSVAWPRKYDRSATLDANCKVEHGKRS